MTFLYEVAITGVQRGIPVANIFHVGDGNESETPDQVADVFEDNYLVDLIAILVEELIWEKIVVTPLDVGNLQDAVTRVFTLPGISVVEDAPSGVHAWVKLISDDNGFKSGGKLIGGLSEDNLDTGFLSTAFVNNLTAVFSNLLTDLVTAGLFLAIYRPTLSTPGFPSFSVTSAFTVRGLGTNNRRQREFQL